MGLELRDMRMQTVIGHAGRGLLALLFILAGMNKLADPDAAAAMIAGSGLPLAGPLAIATGLFEVGAGILLLVGARGAAWAALALALFTFATNIFHPFWALSGEAAVIQMSMFVKNMAIGGGLLFVFASLPHRRV
jgi:putative oxidoreductase